MKHIVLSSLLITSCGAQDRIDDWIHKKSNDDSHHNPTTVATELLPIVNKFKSVFIKQFDLRVEFGKLEYPVVGVCMSWSDGYKEITIDKESFSELDDSKKEELVFHELGHCVLGRKHDEETIELNGFKYAPRSIMYPYVFGGDMYLKNTNYYYGELVNNH